MVSQPTVMREDWISFVLLFLIVPIFFSGTVSGVLTRSADVSMNCPQTPFNMNSIRNPVKIIFMVFWVSFYFLKARKPTRFLSHKTPLKYLTIDWVYPLDFAKDSTYLAYLRVNKFDLANIH